MLAQLLRVEADPWYEIPTSTLTHTPGGSFSDHARSHGLDAFAFGMISKLGLNSLITRQEQEQLMQRSIKHYQHLTRTREGFSQIFNTLSPGIGPVIPLKGIYLTETLYVNKLDRQFGDIDVLISLDDVEAFVEHLNQMGYVSDPYRSSWERNNPTILNHHLPPLRKNSVTVEVHTRLLPTTPSVWFRDFVESSQPVPRSTGIALPDPIHHLLFLMAHLDKHITNGASPWRLFRDLALLTGQNSQAWRAISELAKAYGLSDMAAGIKDELSYLYGWKMNGTRHHYVIRKRSISDRWERIRRVINQLPGTRVKMILIWRWVFPPVHYVLFHHPGYSVLHLLYWYPGRILLVIRKLLLP